MGGEKFSELRYGYQLCSPMSSEKALTTIEDPSQLLSARHLLRGHVAGETQL